ncbi:hypothetical protein [Corynebacterium sp. AOP12-C2-36]|uniref:hypothetical protein n=1 Tax=Corynebacterium sp. AOP12-C2-36 TaxID=3457723 RepID=UPI0040341629
MTGMEFWLLSSIAIIIISNVLVPIFGEFVESVQHPKEVSEAIFFTSNALLYTPIPAAFFLEGSVKDVIPLCFLTSLGHIAMRVWMGLRALPPSPRYIWNAEKTLYRTIMRKDHP